MSLSERRPNAPQHLGHMPTFEIQTPNRTIHRLVSRPSSDSLSSLSIRDPLPLYNAIVDDNPDVITTSVEIDPNGESDSETTVSPPAILLSPSKKITKKKSGLSKLFNMGILQPIYSPGIRLTQLPRVLRSRTKDTRSGFDLSIPSYDGQNVIDIDAMAWMQIISRINILIAADRFADVQFILDADVSLRDKVSFMKLSDLKDQQYDLATTNTPKTERNDSSQIGTAAALLTIPELNPQHEDSDDEANLQNGADCERRGSTVSTNSSIGSTSSKSSFGHRLRKKFEKREEWCLVFEH